MSDFSRPSLSDLIARNEADINAALRGADSRVRRSVLSVLAKITAAQAHLMYGYLDYILDQVFPDKATGDNLKRYMSIFRVPIKLATKASGPVTLTGNNGAAINIGSILTRGDNVQFQTISAATITGGTATVTIEALNAGESGNSVTNTTFNFISPISGIQATCLSSDAISGGTDDEKEEDSRIRLLLRLQNPPQGGCFDDYLLWATNIPGVTRAFPVRHEAGIGSVTVRLMMDNNYADGIPQPSDIARAQAYFDSVAPLTAEVFVLAPIAAPINYNIRLINKAGGTETSSIIRAAVDSELSDMIRRDAVPGGTILFEHANEAISIAPGEFNHNIISPNADVTNSTGYIATMGTTVWAP